MAAVPAAEPGLVAAVPPPAEPVRGTPPRPLPGPEGEPDDLKLISGIGPGIEKTLHGLGIYHFRQIAELTPDNVAWIDQRLRFRGRIQREDWIGQASGWPAARRSTRRERRAHATGARLISRRSHGYTDRGRARRENAS